MEQKENFWCCTGQIYLAMDCLENRYGWVDISQFGHDRFQRFVHPDYKEIVQHGTFSDTVFLCLNVLDDAYLELVSTESMLILKKNVFHVMPVQPKFKPQGKVKFLNSKGFIEIGSVRGISWHNKDKKHIYSLEVNGKVKGRRYFEEDLDNIL